MLQEIVRRNPYPQLSQHLGFVLGSAVEVSLRSKEVPGAWCQAILADTWYQTREQIEHGHFASGLFGYQHWNLLSKLNNLCQQRSGWAAAIKERSNLSRSSSVPDTLQH